uniref:Uncharacterized protein n=1 Tax=Vespula pensylvanica TaxID=30213 RepID=A0A834N9I1_VESPE|nr:hypothetical protein H0235_015596 [Vespula pensylvanica]
MIRNIVKMTSTTTNAKRRMNAVVEEGQGPRPHRKRYFQVVHEPPASSSSELSWLPDWSESFAFHLV